MELHYWTVFKSKVHKFHSSNMYNLVSLVASNKYAFFYIRQAYVYGMHHLRKPRLQSPLRFMVLEPLACDDGYAESKSISIYYVTGQQPRFAFLNFQNVACHAHTRKYRELQTK